MALRGEGARVSAGPPASRCTPRYCTSVRSTLEALTGVDRDRRVRCRRRRRAAPRQTAVAQVQAARPGQHRAEAATGGLRVHRDDVDLAVRRVLVEVDLGPVEAEQSAVVWPGVVWAPPGTGRPASNQSSPVRSLEVLVGHVTLLGVVGERGRVDLEQSRLVGGLEGADAYPLGHVPRPRAAPTRDRRMTRSSRSRGIPSRSAIRPAAGWSACDQASTLAVRATGPRRRAPCRVPAAATSGCTTRSRTSPCSSANPRPSRRPSQQRGVAQAAVLQLEQACSLSVITPSLLGRRVGDPAYVGRGPVGRRPVELLVRDRGDVDHVRRVPADMRMSRTRRTSPIRTPDSHVRRRVAGRGDQAGQRAGRSPRSVEGAARLRGWSCCSSRASPWGSTKR